MIATAVVVSSSFYTSMAAVIVPLGVLVWWTSDGRRTRRLIREGNRRRPSSIARSTMPAETRLRLEAAEAKRTARRLRNVEHRDRTAAGIAEGRAPDRWFRPHWSPFRRWPGPDWPS